MNKSYYDEYLRRQQNTQAAVNYESLEEPDPETPS